MRVKRLQLLLKQLKHSKRLQKTILFVLNNRAASLLFVLVFAVLGTYLVNIGHGLSPSVGVEPEKGTLAGAVNIVSDVNASGGNYVQFGGNFKLTPLDSTIRVNWVPSTDPTIKWQVISAWDAGNLVSTKVVGPTGNVADINGLRPGDSYTVKLQTIDSNGVVSSPLKTAVATTDPQPPMANAAYYDSFDEDAPGPMDYNYYDVRSWSGYGDTVSIPDYAISFVSERHWHMELQESNGQGGIIVRPRVPASLVNSDGSSRTETLEFEVDSPPVSMAHGKWWDVHFSPQIPDSEFTFGSNGGNIMPNSIMISMVGRNGDVSNNRANSYNSLDVKMNVGNNSYNFTANVGDFTPGNVRIPIVVKLSQTSIQISVNGQNRINGSGFTLPWTQGWWTFGLSNYRSGFIELDNPLQAPHPMNYNSHWDMIQFNGPAGSYNPLVKTYIQPGCDGMVYMQYHSTPNCPAFITSGTTGSVNLTIPSGDDLTKLRSAQLIFTGPIPNGMQIKLNGTSIASLPAREDSGDTMQQLNSYQLTAAQLALLQNGSNTFSFTAPGGVVNYDGVSQLELEAIYNQPRTIDNPPQDYAPILAFTNNDTVVDHIAGQPDIVKGTTYLYNQGADVPINYTLQQLNPDANPWFTITSPTSGTITSPVSGGQMIPVNYTIDFSKYVQPGDQEQGIPVIIKVTGGKVPQYAGILARKDWITSPIPMAGPFVMNDVIYNKSAISGL